MQKGSKKVGGPQSLLHPKLQSLQRISYEDSHEDQAEQSLTQEFEPNQDGPTIKENDAKKRRKSPHRVTNRAVRQEPFLVRVGIPEYVSR